MLRDYELRNEIYSYLHDEGEPLIKKIFNKNFN